MLSSMFFKEYTKTRVGIIATIVVIMAVIISSIVSLSHDIRIMSATQFLSMRVVSGWTVSQLLKVIPIVAGVVLAIVQYVPEAAYGRLKLTLHLPLKENEIIAMMCVYGWLVLVVMTVVSILVLTIMEMQYLPIEMVGRDISEAVRWSMCSLVAYNFTTSCTLERQTGGRIRWGLTGLAVIGALFLLPRAAMETYICTIVFVILSSAAPFVSARRYKVGL